MVSQLNALAAQANTVGSNCASLLDHGCVAADDHAGAARWIAIDPDTFQFVTKYMTGSCDFPAGGTAANFPQFAKDWLKLALEQGPIFLNRYQLDLMGSSDRWDAELMAALAYASQEAGVASQVLSFLEATDVLYYLPSLPVPIPSPNWTDTSALQTQHEALQATSPLEATVAPC